MDTSTSRSLTPGSGAFTFLSATAAAPSPTARWRGRSSRLNVLTAGDLNDDGWADIAAASTSAGSVAIFTGSASGFRQPHTYATGGSPRGVAIADVNQDGGLDVATANRASSTVSVLLADRAHPGRFFPQIPFAAGPGSRDVVAADFDADGRVDLATGNEYPPPPLQSWRTRLSSRVPRDVLGQQALTPGGAHFSQFGNHVWSADFNRDGRADVMMARDLVDDEPWALSVLLTGVGTVPLPQTGYPVALVADVIGDGNADVVYHARDGALRADIGDGRGTVALSIHPTPDAVTIGLVGLDGHVIKRINHRTTQPPRSQEVVNIVTAVVAGMRSELDRSYSTVGAVVVVPGSERFKDELVDATPHFGPQAELITAHLEKALGLPVFAVGAAAACALGESAYGPSRGVRNLVFITTEAGGISAAAIGERVLVTRAHGSSVALGHLLVNTNGAQCRCGLRGCLDTEVSPEALLEALGTQEDPGR